MSKKGAFKNYYVAPVSDKCCFHCLQQYDCRGRNCLLCTNNTHVKMITIVGSGDLCSYTVASSGDGVCQISVPLFKYPSQKSCAVDGREKMHIFHISKGTYKANLCLFADVPKRTKIQTSREHGSHWLET